MKRQSSGEGWGGGLLAAQISLSSQVRGTEPRAVATGTRKLSTTTRRLSCVTILLSDESLSRSLPLSVLYQVHSTSYHRARKPSSPALLPKGRSEKKFLISLSRWKRVGVSAY